jgi:hypothetical protein
MASDDSHKPDISNEEATDILPLPIDEFDVGDNEIQTLFENAGSIDGQIQGEVEEVQRYFILGNYDHPQKERLTSVATEIDSTKGIYNPYLLKDIEVADGNDTFTQFYLKILAVVKRTDIFVLVVEDNDGGHELETGEVPGEDLYILFRDYRNPSIPDSKNEALDLHREKYDAMLWKLIELYEDADRSYSWTSKNELIECVEELLDNVGA